MSRVRTQLGQVAGVRAVHELHVWALTSGRNSLTAHLVIDPSQASEQAVLQAATSILRDRFAITHTTMQIETEDCRRSGELHDDHGEAAHQTHRHQVVRDMPVPNRQTAAVALPRRKRPLTAADRRVPDERPLEPLRSVARSGDVRPVDGRTWFFEVESKRCCGPAPRPIA